MKQKTIEIIELDKIYGANALKAILELSEYLAATTGLKLEDIKLFMGIGWKWRQNYIGRLLDTQNFVFHLHQKYKKDGVVRKFRKSKVTQEQIDKLRKGLIKIIQRVFSYSDDMKRHEIGHDISFDYIDFSDSDRANPIHFHCNISEYRFRPYKLKQIGDKSYKFITKLMTGKESLENYKFLTEEKIKEYQKRLEKEWRELLIETFDIPIVFGYKDLVSVKWNDNRHQTADDLLRKLIYYLIKNKLFKKCTIKYYPETIPFVVFVRVRNGKNQEFTPYFIEDFYMKFVHSPLKFTNTSRGLLSGQSNFAKVIDFIFRTKIAHADSVLWWIRLPMPWIKYYGTNDNYRNLLAMHCREYKAGKYEKQLYDYSNISKHQNKLLFKKFKEIVAYKGKYPRPEGDLKVTTFAKLRKSVKSKSNNEKLKSKVNKITPSLVGKKITKAKTINSNIASGFSLTKMAHIHSEKRRRVELSK